MAQKLKDEVRQAIIDAAKQEFLEKGYKNASMRSIAKKANMTVGNLYRYFKSKEDINLYIVVPTYKMIDATIKSLTQNKVSMETRVFNVKPNIKELENILDELSDRLVDIYTKNKVEFNILMIHSKLNEEITSWFAEMINSLISQSFLLNELSVEKQILSNAYAQAVFEGVKYLFKENESDAKQLKSLLKTYLRSFLYMLDNDLGKIGG